jgi:hypothetical protein
MPSPCQAKACAATARSCGVRLGGVDAAEPLRELERTLGLGTVGHEPAGLPARLPRGMPRSLVATGGIASEILASLAGMPGAGYSPWLSR